MVFSVRSFGREMSYVYIKEIIKEVIRKNYVIEGFKGRLCWVFLY